MEYRMKCTVCGRIYCYTDSDVSQNKANSISAAVSGIATIAQIFGGTMLGAYAMNAQTDRYNQRIKDFTRCPYCNSQSTIPLSYEEWIEEEKHQGSSQLPQSTKPQIEINANATTESLLRRVHLFLEDSEWDTADAYCDKILDVEPENSYAYLGKLMAEAHTNNLDGLVTYDGEIETSGNYKKALRFANSELKTELEALINQRDYYRADKSMQSAKNDSDYLAVANSFRRIAGFRDADEKVEECIAKANDYRYLCASNYSEGTSIADVEKAIELFSKLGSWKDSSERVEECTRCKDVLKEKELKERQEKEQKANEAAKLQKAKAKKIKIVSIAIGFVLIIVVALVLTRKYYIQPNNQYRQALSLRDAGEYDEAIKAFEGLGDYKDASSQIPETRYLYAIDLINSNQFDEAWVILRSLGEYKDSPQQIIRIKEINYNEGLNALQNKDYKTASKCFSYAKDYLDGGDYYNYSTIKATDFDDGNTHNLYLVIAQIKNTNIDEFRSELETIPQIQQAKALNGEWACETESNNRYHGKRTFEDGRISAIQYASKKTEYLTYKDGKYYEYYYSENTYVEIKIITTNLFSMDRKNTDGSFDFIDVKYKKQ